MLSLCVYRTKMLVGSGGAGPDPIFIIFYLRADVLLRDDIYSEYLI